MNKDGKEYEPPTMKVYPFDDNDEILTSSGGVSQGPTQTPDPTPTPNYAANALNEWMGGTNTTIE